MIPKPHSFTAFRLTALIECQRALALGEQDHGTNYFLCSLLATQTNKDNYSSHCSQMLETWAATTDASCADRTLMGCLLRHDTDFHNSTMAKKLAELVKKESPDHGYDSFFKRTLGLYCLRSEDYESCLENCERCRSKSSNIVLNLSNFSIEAMAHFRMGEKEKALTSLAKAMRLFSIEVPDAQRATLNDHWHDWLMAKVLYDEANALILENPNHEMQALSAEPVQR